MGSRPKSSIIRPAYFRNGSCCSSLTILNENAKEAASTNLESSGAATEKKRKQRTEERSQMAKKRKGRALNHGNHNDSSGPRLDPHKRLLSRFYEPLVLLHVLDRNSAQPISHCPSEDQATCSLQLRELRRNFLEQLAYICDFSKGGDTVTAIALEAHPSGVIYWVASNEGPCKRVILFLHETLDLL